MRLSEHAITMQMVAREAGVSVGTVSKVVNGGPCNRELASRVKDAIRVLGYSPNPYARAMRSHRTRCLGILIDQKYCSNTIWLQDLLFQLTETAARFTYQIHTRIMDATGSPAEEFQDFPQRIDGLILLGTFSPEFLAVLDQEFKMPLISYGPRFPLSRVMVIDRDMTDGFTQMFEHLVSLGHRHVVALMTNNQSSKDKLMCLNRAYASVSESCRLHVVQTDRHEDNSQTGYELTGEALERYPEGTVYVFGADALALGGLSQLARQRLCVPDDISLVSIDNTLWAQQTIPALTSLGYDLYELSTEIVTSLLDVIEQSSRYIPKMMHLKLYRRASTASPRLSGRH